MNSGGRDGARPAEGCSSPEDLALLASGEGDEARRLAILDHVMTCRTCQRELDLVRAAASAGREMGSGRSAPAIARRGWLRTYGTLLAAAAVLIAVGLTVGTIRTRNGGGAAHDASTVLRGSGRGDATAAIQLISPANGAQSRLPLTLVWHAVPGEHAGSSAYRVEVLDSTGAPALVEQSVRDTTLALSAQRLRPDENYSWWVSTSLGGSVLRSRLSRLRLVR